MTKKYPTPTRQELIARIHDGLAQFLTVIDQFSEEQMRTVKDAVGWNGRDHLTHLAVWAEGIAALLRREDRWAAMGLKMENPDDDEPDFDMMNEQIVVQHRHLSPAEARTWLIAANEAVVAALKALPEAELELAYDRFVAPFTGDGGRPIWGYVAGNTFGHCLEHAEWIEAIVSHTSQAGAAGISDGQ